MPNVLPAREEWQALAPTPGSPVWRAFNDTRMLSTSLYATLLQVAYPTVGEGVHQYSSFTRDPWGRLLRTLDYVHGSIYGGDDLAGSIGARVRAMHRTIRGVGSDGRRYSAMEPEAFAWVHATLALAIFAGHEHFATPMSRVQRQAFWTEWLGVGRFIGVRERDLPAEIEGFERYVEMTVAERLRWTPAIPDVMDSLSGAPPPALPRLAPLWRLAAAPIGFHLRAVTCGLLPGALRVRLGLRYSTADRAVFALHCALAKRSGRLLVGPLSNFGPSYRALATSSARARRGSERHRRHASGVARRLAVATL